MSKPRQTGVDDACRPSRSTDPTYSSPPMDDYHTRHAVGRESEARGGVGHAVQQRLRRGPASDTRNR